MTVQHEGAARIARLAAELGITTMVQLSAIGSDANSKSNYARTKGLGEETVLRYQPEAMILRPSVIFGAEDGFFNRFAAMTKLSPVLPLVGGDTRFQPVYVDDVARAAAKGIMGEANGLYELGGAEVKTLKDWIKDMLAVIHRRKLVINLPFFAGSLMGLGFDVLQKLTFGFWHNGVLTRDQVKLLRHDNVVSEAAKSFADLDIDPTPASAVIEDYLWRFRPSGQYDAIKASAKNLDP